LIVKKIDNLFDIVFSVLLLSLPISVAIPNILLGVLFLIFLFKKDKVILSNTYSKLVVIYVLYIIFKATFFNTFLENFNIYKQLLVILALSFLFFNVKNVTLVIKGYILGVSFAIILSFFKILKFYLSFKALPFGNTAEVQDLILIHRPYFGFMCLIAIVLIDILFLKLKLKAEKITYLVLAFLIAVFLYVIVARLALFLLVIYLVIRSITYLKFSRTKSVLGFITIVVLITIFFSKNKNLKDRLHIENSYSQTIKVLKNQEPRFVIWDCVFNQINDSKFNFYFGHNNRNTIQDNLNKCYKDNIDNISKRDYYLKTAFNTHNQFLDIFLEGGIVGLTLMLSILFFSLYTFKDSFNSIFVICSFVLFLMVENLFHRQLGVYLFGVFIPLFHKITKEKK
jgi:O-antigen ligase